MNNPVCIDSSNKMELLKEIKENAFFFKLVEMGYEKLVSINVSYSWIIRPLLLMYKRQVISNDELLTRLYIMNVDVGLDLDAFVDKELAKENFERNDEYSKIPEHLKYIGYRSYGEWITEGHIGLIAYFYFGYLPYAYNIVDENYVNIAYYLTENDYA